MSWNFEHDRVTETSISAISLGFLRSLGESLEVLSVPKGKGLLAIWRFWHTFQKDQCLVVQSDFWRFWRFWHRVGRYRTGDNAGEVSLRLRAREGGDRNTVEHPEHREMMMLGWTRVGWWRRWDGVSLVHHARGHIDFWRFWRLLGEKERLRSRDALSCPRNRKPSIMVSQYLIKSLKRVVPQRGLEPPTLALRMRCSTS